MELNNEQKKLLEAATAALSKFNESLPPEGDFVLVNDKGLNDLVAANKAYTRLFIKLKPVFQGFTGGDIMAYLPQLMPMVQNLGKDEELKTDLATILSTL